MTTQRVRSGLHSQGAFFPRLCYCPQLSFHTAPECRHYSEISRRCTDYLCLPCHALGLNSTGPFHAVRGPIRSASRLGGLMVANRELTVVRMWFPSCVVQLVSGLARGRRESQYTLPRYQMDLLTTLLPLDFLAKASGTTSNTCVFSSISAIKRHRYGTKVRTTHRSIARSSKAVPPAETIVYNPTRCVVVLAPVF